ncbi:carbohydrate-binding family 9-like protein [Alkaliflexus imshenetskii]|uniref:carbohydrate-binding family 9-like protein n=1 Tax=Alkaliflexus imshenetskii TaxID=286730 RepID=UPI0004BCD272|nr:carbohydrate-binding family 9-like protein [Alkaliflexus imshenetskii]
MQRDFLSIPFIKASGVDEVADAIDQIAANPIGIASWDSVPDDVTVNFRIAHSRNALLLAFDVVETEVLARFNQNQQPVYRDSCVEMFISFDQGEHYYNLEFNSLGTTLSAWGSGREKRIPLPDQALSGIESRTIINRTSQLRSSGLTNWTLNLYIPVSVFIHDRVSDISGMQLTANFYKCGDDLQKPHFLSWQKIETLQPDFHQPKWFGLIRFS